MYILSCTSPCTRCAKKSFKIQRKININLFNTIYFLKNIYLLYICNIVLCNNYENELEMINIQTEIIFKQIFSL